MYLDMIFDMITLGKCVTWSEIITSLLDQPPLWQTYRDYYSDSDKHRLRFESLGTN